MLNLIFQPCAGVSTVKEEGVTSQLCIFDVKITETKPQPPNDFFVRCVPKKMSVALFMWAKKACYIILSFFH